MAQSQHDLPPSRRGGGKYSLGSTSADEALDWFCANQDALPSSLIRSETPFADLSELMNKRGLLRRNRGEPLPIYRKRRARDVRLVLGALI